MSKFWYKNANSIEPLSIVKTEQQAARLAMEVCHNRLPGFQIEERSWTDRELVGFLKVLQEVEGEVYPSARLVINQVTEEEKAEPYPHIDGYCSGLALHRNRRGVRSLQLAHPRQAWFGDGGSFIPEGMSKERYTGQGLLDIQDQLGQIYRGDVVPGRLSVFSQGKVQEGELRLEPSVHYFTAGNEAAAWTRYASGPFMGYS